MARIEQWGVVPLHVDPYQPPECLAHGIHGVVSGHKSFKDGDEITTSAVISVRHNAATGEVSIITASGSVYDLGEVNSDYEKQFSNARERFIKSNT